jgi:hypothetical protein
MKAKFFNPASMMRRERLSSQRLEHSRQRQVDDSFRCKHCNNYVSVTSLVSGVRNRNHCPYCLWSRHLDLYAVGDRLSACKSLMTPIGLTVKLTLKKYGSCQGELMLIHMCTECQDLSINRIAADDDTQEIFTIFEDSFRLDKSTQARLEACSIYALDVLDRDTVLVRLFGHGSDPVGLFIQDIASDSA